jgi:hypothetical protein
MHRVSSRFLNSGGAITVLVYSRLLNGHLPMNHMQISLFSFTFGIVVISVALMFLFIRTSKVESSYVVDRNVFLNNQLPLTELNKNDDERYDSDNAEYILVLFSFIAFIAGVLYGVFNFA